MTEHFVSETLNKKDVEFDITLRPSRFADFVGQNKVRERLELFIEAAKGRGDVLDHVLLSGPPGLGKTTLANILAAAMGANLKATSGPVIDKPGKGSFYATDLDLLLSRAGIRNIVLLIVMELYESCPLCIVREL